LEQHSEAARHPTISACSRFHCAAAGSLRRCVRDPPRKPSARRTGSIERAVADFATSCSAGHHSVVTVSDLFFYPLKSARGTPLTAARLIARGFEWDRHWMAVGAASSFITQRTHPQLARIRPELTPESLL